MSDTDDTQPTPGKWYAHEDGDGALCVSADRDQGGADQFVAYIKAANNDQYPKAEANARLIAAAGTAAHEAKEMGYDPVKAVEALPDNLERMRRAILDLTDIVDTSSAPKGRKEEAILAAIYRLQLAMAEAGADETMIPGDARAALAVMAHEDGTASDVLDAARADE